MIICWYGWDGSRTSLAPFSITIRDQASERKVMKNASLDHVVSQNRSQEIARCQIHIFNRLCRMDFKSCTFHEAKWLDTHLHKILRFEQSVSKGLISITKHRHHSFPYKRIRDALTHG